MERVLVLGGTGWLGGEVARTAAPRGLDVTVAARGESGAAPRGASFARVDRDEPDGLAALPAGDWDVVIDVARDFRQVERSVAFLADRVGGYVFVSSCSVYAEQSDIGADEGAAVLAPCADDADGASMEQYGPSKARCERSVLEGFPAERSLVLRAGLIAGAGDASGRTTYWPWRFARSANQRSRVLVPDALEGWTQVIDVRDLASWCLDGLRVGLSGAVNAVGDPVRLADHLAVAREVAGSRAPMVPAAEAWLRGQRVNPWSGPRSLPLWIGDPQWGGFMARSNARAGAAGLTPRPLVDTLRSAVDVVDAGLDRASGLTDDEERDLLEALARA